MADDYHRSHTHHRPDLTLTGYRPRRNSLPRTLHTKTSGDTVHAHNRDGTRRRPRRHTRVDRRRRRPLLRNHHTTRREADILHKHITTWADPITRLVAANRSYRLRFPDNDHAEHTILTELRAAESRRIKARYRTMPSTKASRGPNEHPCGTPRARSTAHHHRLPLHTAPQGWSTRTWELTGPPQPPSTDLNSTRKSRKRNSHPSAPSATRPPRTRGDCSNPSIANAVATPISPHAWGLLEGKSYLLR